MQYNPNAIDQKWQKYWAENQTFAASQTTNKPKYYVLDMFPYPSGAGLHVGHPLGYIASDIIARYKRHQGFNVLHPQGYDSFGLPAEQYAIQTGQHPAITTEENITRYRQQLDRIGFSFDWSKEIRTSKPDYYKWTQWIFIQLFNSWYNLSTNKAEDIDLLQSIFSKEGNANVQAVTSQIAIFSAEEWNSMNENQQASILLHYRLTYLAEAEVNWCPELGTVLANDEVINGVSERGGFPVVRKKMTQWMMRITAYAERLLQGLDTIDWSEAIKELQRNWIGKSKGASIYFDVEGIKESKIEVFTTRPDTIFGVSFMTLAPEHELVAKITTPDQQAAVNQYIEDTAKRSERERMADVKKISGVFTGAYAVHPFTNESIPIWIGDYVLAGYGTGAVMAVPAGDDRDYAFAQHFAIPIKNIFNKDITEQAFVEKDDFQLENSDFLNGLDYQQATEKVILALEEKKIGLGKINYRLRDAVFSRQRYWGEPVPIYFKQGVPYTIPTNCLPLELPQVEKYLPTETGEPPLGRAENWAWDEVNQKVVSISLIDNVTVHPLELNTMPGWAGSSWYWMRYMDAQNTTQFASKEALGYWQDVDLYIGGNEHATGHLLYARFWNKFLKDIGVAPTEEPFKKMINQGMILGMSAFVYRQEGTNTFISHGLIGEKNVTPIHVDVSLINEQDNTLNIEGFKAWRQDFKDAEFILEKQQYFVGREVEKMSKSKFNVLNPDDICEEYGADCLRMYEMFLGPLEQSKPWNTQGLSGVYGFLKKLWNLFFMQDSFTVSTEEPTNAEYKILHTLIKKVGWDMENFSFNTSISSFMIAVNDLQKIKCNKQTILESLLIILSPYAPHISEELWSLLGHSSSIAYEKFPVLNEKYLVEDEKEYPVSFNGKMRFKIKLALNLSKEEIEEIVMKDERTIAQLAGKKPNKVIIVPGKIINMVN